MSSAARVVTVADAVADHLCAVGVERIFGYPGEDHLEVLDACVRRGLRYVRATNETAACIMAGAEAQARGTPGVALITLGPGLTNAINGIASAYLDEIPLLVITGQHPAGRLPLTIRQALDNHALVAGVVKWSATVGTDAYELMARALATVGKSRPGPVFLELRDDVARAAVTDERDRWLGALLAPPHALADAWAAGALADVRGELAGARRPVLVVGGRGYSDECRETIRAFARSGRITVLTTPRAKGVVPSSDPWLAGTFLNGNLEGAILERCDLLLTVDLDAADFFNRPWPYAPAALAVDERDATRRLIPSRRDAAVHACGILAALGGAAASEWTAEDVRRYRSAVAATFESAGSALTIPAAIARVRARAPEDAIVTVDAGFGKPLMSLLWETEHADAYYSSHGLSTMGYAIPAANALALARPGRKVIAFLGDGSFLMTASEVSVAVDLGIAPIYVVWMDDALTQVQLKQTRRNAAPVGTGLVPRSCAGIAEAFGARGRDVTTLTELDSALSDALAANAPTVLGVRTDRSAARDWFDAIRA